MADIHQGLDAAINIVWNELKDKAKLIKGYGDLPRVSCNAQQINQVFMNLLVNAADAIEKQGTIHVRTCVQGDNIAVHVSDTGRGIPKQNMSKIFDPFFTTKEIGEGTGLGLSMSYGIIKNITVKYWWKARSAREPMSRLSSPAAAQNKANVG